MDTYVRPEGHFFHADIALEPVTYGNGSRVGTGTRLMTMCLRLSCNQGAFTKIGELFSHSSSISSTSRGNELCCLFSGNRLKGSVRMNLIVPGWPIPTST
eukprot:scaffold51625_cov50-Cyclotella_meneghiniana.AAC.2